MKNIEKIGLAIIENGKLLILRNAGTSLFLMPGGRVEHGEEPLETLAREIKEELQCELITESSTYLGEFSDVAANDPGKIVRIKLFSGKIKGDIVIDNEIEEMKWFDPKFDDHEILSPIVKNKILPSLIQSNLLCLLEKE